jgi:hypothetical protein
MHIPEFSFEPSLWNFIHATSFRVNPKVSGMCTFGLENDRPRSGRVSAMGFFIVGEKITDLDETTMGYSPSE